MKETYLPPKFRGPLAFEELPRRRRKRFDWTLAWYAFAVFILCASTVFILCASIVFAGVLTWAHYQ